MANISTFLQAIMSARYGKDVRQSIHDGIKAINDEVAADKNEVIASKEAAENAATAASTSAQEASASESAAKKSETAAAASESAASTSAQEASASESAAKKSETAAAASESAASTSAQEASASESAAKKSENAAAASESAAATSAQKASASESAAKKSETAAAASKSAASTSAQTAIDKATLAKSYAVGGTGTRAGEDTDNAKYYMTQAEKQTGGIPTKLSQLENDAGFIAEDGDGSGLTVGFTEAAARENIASGENTGTLMGKIKKWLADLAAAAFMQVITSYADLMAGTALDNYLIGAAAAKEGFTELNGKLGNFYLLYSHLCGTAGNSIWRQNPQFPEEYYAQYTVPEKEGYRFFFSFWQISWTNNNEYCNYLIRNPFLHEKNGNIEVYSKDGTPTFVPVFLCIYLPV